jgi:acetylornithine deacetylase/succinyl-diaminopimelate desuccinylase-like protein
LFNAFFLLRHNFLLQYFLNLKFDSLCPNWLHFKIIITDDIVHVNLLTYASILYKLIIILSFCNKITIVVVLQYNQQNKSKQRINMNREKTQSAITAYHQSYQRLYKEFLNFLKIPSVSTSVEHRDDVKSAADFLVEKLQGIGLNHVKAYPTPVHPIVYGDYIFDDNKPTVLLYGHYDVQPADPLDEWETPPFEPSPRGDYLFARGASDMKGQIWATISALQSVITSGDLAFNVKYLIEGEEEIGSPSLNPFLQAHKDLLACDFVLNPDAGMIAPDKPTIVYALRGMAYFELRIFGPKADLHSGMFGGVVENPANVLSQLIAGMKDENGAITLPGFYDRVRKIGTEEHQALSKLGMDATFYKNISGVPELGGEPAYLPVERTSARPTLDVNGIYSGFTGEGAKTIIPASAMAKISTRLVPDQDPEEAHASMRTYLEQNVPSTVRWELEYMSGAPAYINHDNTRGLSSFKEALRTTWGVEPLMKREGGSIPVATSMKNILGVDSIITGFGLPDDQIHSPNERLHIPTHKKGVEALIRFFLSN